jgi:hypothetical protein
MNDTTGGGPDPRGRSRARRAGVLSAVVASIALLAAACGGGNSDSAAGTTAYQKALAYAECMRAHNVPGFPDPTSNGSILITPKDHLAQGSPQFVAANKACQHLLPPSKPLTAAQQRKLSQQMLRWVACIRAHGEPDMPDPVINSQGVELHGPPGGPFSPTFRAAQRACRSLGPGALP